MYSFTPSSSMSFGHIAALDGATKFSLSLLVNFSASTGAWTTILGQLGNATGAGNTRGFSIIRWDTQNRLYITTRNASAIEAASSIDFTFGSVQSLVLAYDGSLAAASRMTAYVNGSAVTVTTENGGPATSVGTTDQPFTLATSEGGLYGTVQIAELAMWFSTTLTAGQAAQLGKRMSPLSISPIPDFYAPLIRHSNDLCGGLTGTNSGGTVVEHPRVYA